MATFAEANDLLNKVAKDARPAAIREEEQVTAFARNATGNASLQLQWWDKSFWAERQREALFKIRQEELREYLPLDSVMGGLFKVGGAQPFGVAKLGWLGAGAGQLLRPWPAWP